MREGFTTDNYTTKTKSAMSYFTRYNISLRGSFTGWEKGMVTTAVRLI